MTAKEIETFKELCASWARNKKGLGCNVSVEKCGVTIRPMVSNCPLEYQKATDNLVKKIAGKAIQYISSSLVFPVAPDDQAKQMKALGAILHDIVVPLLNHLYEFGFESFNIQVQNHMRILQMRYELDHLMFDETGNWIRWNGSIWSGNGWDGDQKTQDDIAQALNAFMSTQIQIV